MAMNTNENPQFIVSPRGNPRARIREDNAVPANLADPFAWPTSDPDPLGSPTLS